MPRRYDQLRSASWKPLTAQEHAATRERLKILLKRRESDIYPDRSLALDERLKQGCSERGDVAGPATKRGPWM